MKMFLLAAAAILIVGCSNQCVQPSPFEPIANCGTDGVECNWQVD